MKHILAILFLYVNIGCFTWKKVMLLLFMIPIVSGISLVAKIRICLELAWTSYYRLKAKL
jgi:hypothetical protein